MTKGEQYKAFFKKAYKNSFGGFLGIEVKEVHDNHIVSEMKIRPDFLNPNGVIHGGCLASFADTCAGDSVMTNLPENAKGFTTLEFKCNFVRKASEGTLQAISKPIHLGRSTQVWQVDVYQKGNVKVVASFNCTQMIIY